MATATGSANETATATATQPPTSVRILLPADGDEYLVEAGIPAGAQAIPVRLLVPRGVARVTVRSGAAAFDLAPPFTWRIPAVPGRQRLEVWLPGSEAPAAVSQFTVRGGGA